MECECLNGSFKAEAWHVGKHVAADVDGFNWRLNNADVDLAIMGLQTSGQTVFTGPRCLVTMDNIGDRVVIHAYDTGIPEHFGCHAILSATGRSQFLEVLLSVKDREDTENWWDVIRRSMK